ncbi:MAG TPA: plastocyanin/azurin family copper-binding protein [Mycobacteriales bacterium]|nr:plastocyanin/azurin family copper-binding protein [Mycobacteriales bacterium]
MSRIFRTALAFAATAAIAGACGSAGTAAPSPTAAPTTAAPSPAAVNIDVQGFKFPANTDVAKGTKVTWTNKDTTKHTVTSGTRPNKDGKFDGQLDASTGTFSFTFAEAGTFSYWCSFHSSMNATITVK